MTVAEDLQGDWQYREDVVDLTHTPHGGGDATPEVKAHSDGMTYAELARGAEFGVGTADQVWVVWADTLSATPARGDKLTDASEDDWYVKMVVEKRIGSTVLWWRCVCRKGSPT